MRKTASNITTAAIFAFLDLWFRYFASCLYFLDREERLLALSSKTGEKKRKIKIEILIHYCKREELVSSIAMRFLFLPNPLNSVGKKMHRHITQVGFEPATIVILEQMSSQLDHRYCPVARGSLNQRANTFFVFQFSL